jgi:hypothetical protein
VGVAAEIIKVDGEILSIRNKMLKGKRRELQVRLDELLKQRQAILVKMEKQAKERIR